MKPRSTFETIWRVQQESATIRHKEKESRRLLALNAGERAEYGYWKDENKPVTVFISEENVGETPTPVGSDAEYVLEFSYETVNEIFLAGESPVNLHYRTRFGDVYTCKNALLLETGYVLKDINGVRVKRRDDGLFYRLPFYQFW